MATNAIIISEYELKNNHKIIMSCVRHCSFIKHIFPN